MIHSASPRAAAGRRGTVVPLLAVCVVALFSFIALAVDLGVLMVARTNCQASADAAALAGARMLDNKPTSTDNNRAVAEGVARTTAKNNKLLAVSFADPNLQTVRAGLYDYNTTTQIFEPSFPGSKPANKSWSAMEVVLTSTQPTYFARIFGVNAMPTGARAVAVHRPRDVAMVLDFTGSMGYSSKFNFTGRGYNSNDPVYPQFGHYQRYTAYTTTNPTASDGSGNPPGGRPNPLYQTATVVSAPYVYSPGNFTVTTPNGPPIVRDYRFDPRNAGTPTDVIATVNTGLLANAFHAVTFNPTARTATAGPTPAPAALAAQADDPATFAAANYGDRWPRKAGATTGVTWSPTDPAGAAITAAEYLGWVPAYSSGALPTGLPAAITSGATNRSSGASWANFRDATWERYGYTLDVAHYIANRNAGLTNTLAQNNGRWDPRWDAGKPKDNILTTDNPPTQSTYTPKTDMPFNGYTLGPGYWGKTFFIWPPDPRPAHDWRRKFFLKGNGTPFVTGSEPGSLLADPLVDASTNSNQQNVNEALLTGGNGFTLQAAGGGTYAVNYPAVLEWIRSGPQTLPPNLRAGRVKFYTSIPVDVDTASGASADEMADKAFWKGYIDFVLRGPAADLAGTEPVGWPEGVTPSRLTGNLTGYVTPTSPTPNPWLPLPAVDPRPYMGYTDNPARPRMHFWFGPLTMMAYIHNNTLRWASSSSRTLIPGTVHEAQSWQLKAGVAAALDDIKANAPNNLVGMSFFSNDDYNSIVVHMGQDWERLKNSLFYPRSLLNVVESNPSQEVRLYNTSLAQTNRRDVPNAKGSTDPNTGLSLAFNMLAASPNVNADPNRRGRRGAAKIVIFETDGVPNSTQNFQFNARGFESWYSAGGSVSASPQQAAWDVVTQIAKPTATTNSGGTDSGHSLPNTPARVYAIGFGDIFSTSAGPAASSFLLEVQKRGNTSAASDTAMPANQIITGEFDVRINNLRDCLERIMQSGVQVTLIE